MGGDSNTRAYNSEVRRRGAARNRAAMLDAARELFGRDGLEATTIPAIARRAGVSAQSVYAVFGSKAGLLRELLTSLEADADAEGWWKRIHAAGDPAPRLGAFADWTTALYRTGFGLIRAAQRTDGPDVAALRAAGDQRRRDALTAVLAPIASRLRAGLDLDDAVDRAFVLTGATVYFSCVDDCGWTDEAYARWLTQLLVTDLLG